MGINPKVNVREQVKFKFAYYDVILRQPNPTRRNDTNTFERKKERKKEMGRKKGKKEQKNTLRMNNMVKRKKERGKKE